METLSGHLVGSQSTNGHREEDQADLVVKRRAAKLGDEAAKEREMLWRLSEAEYHRKRRERLRLEWVGYYRRTARNILKTAAARAEDLRAKADALEEE